MLLEGFFNSVPRRLISLDFYIQYGPYSFDCYFFYYLHYFFLFYPLEFNLISFGFQFCIQFFSLLLSPIPLTLLSLIP